MGSITNENRRTLETANSYHDAALSGMVTPEFSTALAQLWEEKGVSTLSVVEASELSKSYINKLRNPSEKSVNPSRHVIIDLALAINATLEETNHLLKQARYQELYTRDRAESLIIWGMLKGYSGYEIRQMLIERELDFVFKKS